MVHGGRVRPAFNYQASEHGVRWRSILVALANCHRVVKALRHPDGYVAWGMASAGSLLRVDFDLERRDDGDWALVVTAFEVVK